MAQPDSIIQPFVTNTATAIVRRDSNSAWDSAVEKFAAPKASPRVVTRTGRFKTFVGTLTKESKRRELNHFVLGQNFKISDVQREANAALQAYEERGSSLKSHFLRTLGRDFTNNASAAEALLAFLPDGEYTFILCGALTLVFNAAKRIANIREQILNCLGTLTRTVEGTKGFQQFYSGDKRLWEAAENLYIALLDAVEDILAWLDDGAWRRTLSAIFKQDNCNRPLEEKIKFAVETRVKEFHEKLEYCQHERIQLIHIGVDGVARSVDNLQKEMQKWQNVQQIRDEELTQRIVTMLQGQESNDAWLRQKADALQEALNRLAQNKFDSTIFISVRQPTITSAALLTLLHVDPGMLENDLRLAMHFGQTLPPQRQDRAASLLQHARFQSWLKSGRCEILVVNGNDTHAGSATMSPLTYLIGLLGRILASTPTSVPLVAICGRHASPDDALEGAEGVLRLLIYQLLAYLGDSADLSALDYTFVDAVRSGDIRYLCALFRSLIVSFVSVSHPPCVLVCLVDGVSFLETSARHHGLQTLVAFLQQLVMDTAALDGRMIFKVLLTYPYMSRYAHDWFPPEAILTLGQDSSGDGNGYDLARLTWMSESVVLEPSSMHGSSISM